MRGRGVCLGSDFDGLGLRIARDQDIQLGERGASCGSQRAMRWERWTDMTMQPHRRTTARHLDPRPWPCGWQSESVDCRMPRGTLRRFGNTVPKLGAIWSKLSLDACALGLFSRRHVVWTMCRLPSQSAEDGMADFSTRLHDKTMSDSMFSCFWLLVHGAHGHSPHPWR